MATFYIDFQCAEECHRDDIGSTLDSFEHARNAAASVVTRAASEMVLDGGRRLFVATVRDESGTPLYRATLTFDGELLADARKE